MRDSRLDFLKTIAIVMVILIHTFCVVEFKDNAGWYFKIQWFVNQFSHSAVPIFIMVTGALSINAIEAPFLFLRKRLMRIIIPTFLASGFYLIMRYIRDESLIVLLRDLTRGQPYYHLWYAYMLIVLTVLLPLVARVVFLISKVFSLVVGIIIILVSQLTGADGWCGVVMGIGYLCIGMAIYPMFAKGYANCMLCVGTLILGLLFTGYGSWIGLQSMKYGSMGYTSLYVLISSIAYFVSALSMPGLDCKQTKWLSIFSFGIYLFHPMIKFIPGVFRSCFLENNYGAFLYGLFCFMVVSMGTFILVYILSRVRMGRILIGLNENSPRP